MCFLVLFLSCLFAFQPIQLVLLGVIETQKPIADLALSKHCTSISHLRSCSSSKRRFKGSCSLKYSSERPICAMSSSLYSQPPSGCYESSRSATMTRAFFSFIYSNKIEVETPPASPPKNPPIRAPRMGTGIKA
jgi:hypothetical protein